MQHELGWDVVNCYDEWSGGVSNQGRDGKREGGNIEHRTPNIEHRSEEKGKKRTNPALQRLNLDLSVEAVEGAVEEMEILNDESVVSFGCAGTSFWIFNGRGRSQAMPLLNPNSEEVEGWVSALVDGLQYFWCFHRLVKIAILLKPPSIFTESGVSRIGESGDFVKIRPPSACALPRFGAAGLFMAKPHSFSNPLNLSEFLFNKKTSE